MAVVASSLDLHSSVGLQVIRKDAWVPDQLTWTPRSDFGKYIKECLGYLPAEMAAELIERVSRIVVLESSLAVVVYRQHGAVENYGIVGRKVVTDTGVAYIVDAFQNTTELENMKFHGLGTGSTAESASQTALVTELTTEYTGDVRATGTTTEGASANIYRTVATNTLDGTPGAALREHAVFSASSAGTMLDRTLYSAITLSSGDALQSTYELTLTSGS
jgi:hypothetical protein